MVKKTKKRERPLTDHVGANADMIKRALRGAGPDKNDADKGAGARIVANMSCVYVPKFCDESARGEARPYKNTYDLTQQVGAGPSASKVLTNRQRADQALPVKSCKDVYFGAVELNGSGIRFYGDICLVLKADAVPDDTLVLESNSYDLIRPPLWNPQHPPSPKKLKDTAKKRSGSWADDLPRMAVKKVLDATGSRSRRLTTGQISRALLDDEDYIEVLKIGSFGADDLQEVRLSAADAAKEQDIAERQRSGPAPDVAALTWRQNRRDAVAALVKRKVPVRVVTTLGRVGR